MRTPDEVAAMLRLRALGWGERRIATALGCNRQTVRRYLAAEGWVSYRTPRRAKQLDGLQEWLAERFRRHRGNADVVRQDLAREKGLAGAGRESRDGAVDRGAAGFATLQADIVAAMTKAGQRGSRGMRQPPSGGDQLFQPGALIALEQFDHACDLRALSGRRRSWCGRCAPGRRHICCGLRFRRIIVRIRRNGRAWYGEPRSSAGMAFSPATVNFNEYAWPVSSSRRQISIPVFALISRTRPAFRSWVAKRRPDEGQRPDRSWRSGGLACELARRACARHRFHPSGLPIRLMQTPATCRVRPRAGIKVGMVGASTPPAMPSSERKALNG